MAPDPDSGHGSRSSDGYLRLRARLKVNLPVDPMCFWHVMLGWSRLTEYLYRAYVKNGDTKQHKFEIIWNNDGYYRFNMKNNSFPERPKSLSMGPANDCAMMILIGEWMCTITNLQWAQTSWFGVWKTSCLFKWTIFSGLLESLGWSISSKNLPGPQNCWFWLFWEAQETMKCWLQGTPWGLPSGKLT